MKKNSESIKPGYKMTQLGLIPENWEVKRLTSFAKIQAGATPSTTNPEYWGGKIRWMNSGELNFKKIYEVANRITEKGLKSSSTKVLPVNCVLIGLAGQGKTRGTVAINKVQLCTNQSVAAILPNESFEPEYIYYNLDSRYKELRQLSIGDGGRGGLNLKLIGSLKLPLPPISEQKAIVKILSTWDEAIEKTRLLIEQKELRKKALMQQLLTGKKRLQGFTEDWKRIRIKDIGFIPIKLPIKNLNNERLLTVKLYSKGLEFNKNEKFLFSTAGRPYYKRYLGEILIGRQNIHNGGIGVVEKAFDGHICSNAITSFKVHEDITDLTFVMYYLCHERNYRSFETFMGGTGQKELSEGQFLDLIVTIPSKIEQTAIAQILQKVDEEIKLEKQKLEQLKLQKKALMQVLLTGKKRVINIKEAKCLT